MSNNIHSELSSNPLREAARNIAHETADAAQEATDRASYAIKEVTDTAKEAAKRAAESAKDMYHTATLKAEEALTTSKEYVRRNPVPVVLVTIAIGTAIGYILMKSLHKPTFRERYADEPLDAVREAILGALSPVSRSVHRGYDSTVGTVEKALDNAHRYNSKRAIHSFSDRVSRIGDNLKFW